MKNTNFIMGLRDSPRLRVLQAYNRRPVRSEIKTPR